MTTTQISTLRHSAFTLAFLSLLCANQVIASEKFPGEETIYVSNGIRITFSPESLLNHDCTFVEDGVYCYSPDKFQSCAVAKTRTLPLHDGSSLTAKLTYSAAWQGWVRDASEPVNTPFFSLAIVAVKNSKVVQAKRTPVLLADFRDQVVQTRQIEPPLALDYILAHARRQEARVDLEIPMVDGEATSMQVEVGELFPTVGLTVHSITLEVANHD